ncbi:MAG: methionyl-tRNA formyltransferase [Clostridia bacterium]|nr:methionyl-tRNA formyltransferase [Clostridia bacterium]
MKIVFAGTPEFALAPLQAIVKAGYNVVCVVTQTDKPQGRKGVLTPPPVKAWAETQGIPVFQPTKIRDEVATLRSFGGDVMITCAYGQILTQDVLDSFPMGVYNIHASLLPKYRGASPIQQAVLDGERETGVTVMKTELGIDSGDVLLQKSLEVGNDTAGELAARLSVLGGESILEALPLLESGRFTLRAQEGEPTHVKKIKREDARVDFSKSGEEIVRLVRGMNPSPVAFCYAGEQVLNLFNAETVAYDGEEENGTVLTDSPKQGLTVKCLGGAVKLTEVQLAGGKRMKASDFLNGRKVVKGQKLS